MIRNILKKIGISCQILNTSYYLVFLEFLFDSAMVWTLSTVWDDPIIVFVIVGIIYIAKILFLSGVYGSFIEIISGERLQFSFMSLKDNALKLWWVYACLTILFFCFKSVAVALFPGMEKVVISLAIVFKALFYFFFACVVVLQKRYDLRARTNLFYLENFSSIGVLLLLNFSLNIIITSTGSFPIFILKILSLVSIYIHLILFLLIVMFVFGFCRESSDSNQKQEIFLINPVPFKVEEQLLQLLRAIFFNVLPSVFVVIKALTPEKYRIREFANVHWHDRYYRDNVLVAITCHTINAHEAYKIAEGFKKKGSKVVMGGPHVMFLPDEALEYCDSVVIGDAHSVWREIVQDYEKGALKNKYYGDDFIDYPPEVHKQLLASVDETIALSIEAVRGCKYNCEFCSSPMICGFTVRKKPISEIVELVKRVRRKHQYILFQDNNIFADPEYSKKLFEALKPLNIRWIAYCSIDIARDDEMLDLAKESGCFMLRIGYEISDVSSEVSKGGKYSLSSQYRKLTKKIRKKNIFIIGYFIFGHDSDNFWSLCNLIKFIVTIPVSIVGLAVSTPLPGSRLYYKMLKEDRMINLNWINFDASKFVFKHGIINEGLCNRFFGFLSGVVLFRGILFFFISLIIVLIPIVVYFNL